MADADRGTCRECGARLVDWSRVHAQDIRDVAHTFDCLRLELFRHHFWHVEIPQRAVNYARRKGRARLREAVRKRIVAAIGEALPARDGYQTPREGSSNPIHYAQHASASCCRRCLEEWHGIPTGRPLLGAEVTYITDLAMRYLTERLPALTEGGEIVPPVRTPAE
ncbi:MAG: DUF4186 family protein [Dehalococcoidia bacterium]